MAASFILKGNNGGRKALGDSATPLEAVGLALSISAERSCRVLVTREGMTLAAAERGELIDPSMADFPEAIPQKRRK